MDKAVEVQFFNSTSGFSGKRTVEDGTRIDDFFHSEMGEDACARDYTISLNGAPVTRDAVLKDGDRLSVIPANIKGA